MTTKLWGYDSLLETPGVFGVVVAFLAITNGIWAPALYYGLVVLSSNMLEDDDVVTFENNAESIYILPFLIETLHSTRSTKTLRSYFLSSPKLINEAVYKASLRHGINLATPITMHEVD